MKYCPTVGLLPQVGHTPGLFAQVRGPNANSLAYLRLTCMHVKARTSFLRDNQGVSEDKPAGDPKPFCALPIALRLESIALEAQLAAQAQLSRVVACAETGFAVPVMGVDRVFEEAVAYVITPQLAAELVAEGRLRWIG
jgi:hypothetical protein